jgi:hypothetical protein
MKNFLFLRKSNKQRKPATWTRLPDSESCIRGESYPIYVSNDAFIDENCPFLLKKGEEADRSLTENPPPEFILKRMRGIE